MSAHNTEVAIIGGGVIGCSIAYHLSRAGVKVVVVERRELASEASGANVGIIIHGSKGPGPLLDMLMRGTARFGTFKEEIGHDIEYRRTGGLTAFLKEEEFELAQAIMPGQLQAGLDIRLLSPQEAQKLNADFPSSVLGAAYCPIDGILNPFKVTTGYADAAHALGAEFWLGEEVQSIARRGGRVVGLETSRGSLAADLVVLAAGSWSPALAGPLGLDLPITPCRGQMIITEKLPSTLAGPIIMGFEPAPRQTLSGNVIIGSTPQFVGFDKHTTLETFKEFSEEVVTYFPSLQGVHALRTWAGLRPATPDATPILGTPDGYEGLVLACGHHRNGVGESPATGEIISRFITAGEVDPIMAHCSLTRFAAEAAT